ncbi:MAG: long-chain fatty acid--CoA ligase [Saprospiraceae bacterium]|nr:long-chain fatty acid--CoA ligase [Saprospiraceae bacterium]
MKLTRLFDILDHQQHHYPQQEALCDLFEGELRSLSTEQIRHQTNQIAHGLLEIGLQPGDRVGLVMYRNRIEFTLLDLGIQKAGLVSVPLYPTISSGEYEYILKDSGCKVLFYGGGDLATKLSAAKTQVPSLKHLFTLDVSSSNDHWETIWQDAADTPLGTEIDGESLVTIIYTSGTTGHPKGVMLSHRNILENALAAAKLIPIEAGDVVMSFLPLCHIFERTTSFCYLYCGVSIVFTPLDNLGGEDGDLRRVKPHFMTCVPRLLEKVYEKIYQKGLELSGIKNKLFFWALDLTNDYHYDKIYTGKAKIKHIIADRLIYSKWREALGGNLVGIITGSAPCPERIAQVFSAAGIPIREGYGLTESSPGITINGYNEGQAMLGTVGPVLDKVEIMIDKDGAYQDDEGEILAAGPNIMIGYYNKPEETAKVIQMIDGKRWLRTGDIGKIIKNDSGTEFLKITDRKKELLKTSGGKYIAPAPMENKLKENILVEQAMVVGDRRKFVSALIVPAEEPLKNYCLKSGMTWTELAVMIKNQQVISIYNNIIDELNKDLARYAQVKKCCLIPHVWVPIREDGSEGELTPTLKLKRRIILEKYDHEINALYLEGTSINPIHGKNNFL